MTVFEQLFYEAIHWMMMIMMMIRRRRRRRRRRNKSKSVSTLLHFNIYDL